MLKGTYDVRSLCKAVKLHHSVYYYHKQNRENSYKKANEELDKKIKEEYEKSKKRYGSPKIAKILNKQGIKASQKRVARRMKLLGLKSIIVKKYNHKGNKKVDDTNKRNLLEQNFKAEKPSEKWYLLLTKHFLIELENKKQKDILMNVINSFAIIRI